MENKYKALNKEVGQWAKLQAQKMRRKVGALTIKDRHSLKKKLDRLQKIEDYRVLELSIGSRIKTDFGQVSRINFMFPKQGIWFEHGVGRGRKKKSAKATPARWLYESLDPKIDELADIIAKHAADAMVAEIKFFIPGIINKNIKINNG